MFRAADREPGHLIRLFEGALPDPKPDRKKQKPDFEALTLLPAYGEYPHGALLALGSGSKRNRRMGALLTLDAQGAVRGSPRVVVTGSWTCTLRPQVVMTRACATISAMSSENTSKEMCRSGTAATSSRA